MTQPKDTIPMSYATERVILAAMMTQHDALVEGLSTLTPEDFIQPDGRTVFRIMAELFQQGETVDMVTVSVAHRKVSGPKSMTAVTDQFKDSFIGDYRTHMRTAKDLARRRKAISAFQYATEQLNGPYKTEEVISELISNLQAGVGEKAKRPMPLSKVLVLTQKRVELALERKSGITGIPTGFQRFDEFIGGIQPGELMVIGARPSMGKSALLAGICLGAAERGYASLIVNAEMELIEVGTRMLAKASGVPNMDIRRGRLLGHHFADLIRGARKLDQLPIWIYDDTRWEVIKMQIQAMKKQRPDLAIVAIDYVQRIQVGQSHRELRYESLGRVAREAKDIARDLHLAVVIAAQLSRSVEKEGKEPQLSDFRECGDLEQEADIASFLHCYNKDDKSNIHWLIKKNRNGQTATVHLRFIGDDVAFYDWEDGPE